MPVKFRQLLDYVLEAREEGIKLERERVIKFLKALDKSLEEEKPEDRVFLTLEPKKAREVWELEKDFRRQLYQQLILQLQEENHVQ